MQRIFYFLTLIILSACLFLNAEEPLIIKESTNFAYESNSVTLPDGIVSVWADTKTSCWKLFAQKVDANGNMLWNDGEPLLIDGELGNPFPYIDVVVTSDNCIITTWIGCPNYETYRLCAQKISSEGEILWSQGNEIILNMDDYMWEIALVANDIGGTYLFYDLGDHDIYGLNMDADANDLWANNPSPIIPSGYLFTALSDNTGGCILFYEATSNNDNITAARVTSSQEILWEQIITTTVFSYPEVNAISVGASNFVICWSYFQTPLYGQRLDSEGNIYWGDEGIELTTENFPEHHQYSLTGNDDNFFIVYPAASSVPNEYSFKITKLDLAGNSLWENETILDDANIYLFDAQVDDNQRCHVLWYSNSYMIAQNIDSDGNKLWGDEGIILGSDYYNVWTQYGIQVNMLDNNSFFTWQLIQGDEAVLRHQCLDQSGNLLFPGDGIDLQNGMISGIYNWQLLANDNSFYYLWEDYSASQNRIYVQRVFPNGNFYFAENGIPITETTYSSQINYVCKSLPDGGIVAAWN